MVRRILVVKHKGPHGCVNAELDRIAGPAWERADGLDALGQLRRKLEG